MLYLVLTVLNHECIDLPLIRHEIFGPLTSCRAAVFLFAIWILLIELLEILGKIEDLRWLAHLVHQRCLLHVSLDQFLLEQRTWLFEIVAGTCCVGLTILTFLLLASSFLVTLSSPLPPTIRRS